MAIDSASKRKSVAGRAKRTPGVTPDAAKPVAWRQQAGRSYSGIEPDTGEPVPRDITLAARRNTQISVDAKRSTQVSVNARRSTQISLAASED